LYQELTAKKNELTPLSGSLVLKNSQRKNTLKKRRPNGTSEFRDWEKKFKGPGPTLNNNKRRKDGVSERVEGDGECQRNGQGLSVEREKKALQENADHWWVEGKRSS